MSSTNRGRLRNRNDLYETPPGLSRRICSEVRLMIPGARSPNIILEPGCGGGNFLDAATDEWPESGLVGIEIDQELAEKCRAKGYPVICGDFLAPALTFPKPDLVLGNPPFMLGEDFIRKGLDCLDIGGMLAFILRLNFLGSRSRLDFWKWAPLRHIWILSGRPSFTQDGKTDSIEYMVALFEKGYGPGRATLSWISDGQSGRLSPAHGRREAR